MVKQTDIQEVDDCLVCKGQNDFTDWIQCSACNQWYHLKCINLAKVDADNFMIYHCSRCVLKYGPLQSKRRLRRTTTQIDYAALNEGNTFAVDKLTHPHVTSFKNFINPSPLHTFVDMVDSLPTKSFVENFGVCKPLLVTHGNIEKLGMKLPQTTENITIPYITDIVGEETPVEVMDVLTQQSLRPSWDMQKWNEYYGQDPRDRDRIRNVISLEILQLKIGQDFKRPKLVEDMDVVDKIWPRNKIKSENGTVIDLGERPKVTKYCLMSVCGSFTDFHIDFGGTSVYYTVCKGEKLFLMFPPSDHNLDLYKQWCLEQDQNFIWLPDYQTDSKKGPLSGGFKATLKVGDVFIIPSGWIHAVYTPSDSIVIGGNFLTLKDCEMQFKINKIEKLTRVPQRFRFPSFNKVIWLIAWYYYNHQEDFIIDTPSSLLSVHPKTPMDEENPRVKRIKLESDMERNTSERQTTQSYRLRLIGLMIEHLKSHLELSKSYKPARNSIPSNLIGPPNVFLEELSKWISSMH